MNRKNAQRITDAIHQFKLSSVTIEQELSNWKSNRSEQDLPIFFIMRLAAYKANLLALEETISELLDVNLSQTTEMLSQEKDVMKLLGGNKSD